jgi:muconolactone delta-isomerase
LLYFSKLRIEPRGLTQDQLWDLWEVGADTAQNTIAAGGPVVSLYKVVGQRRVIVINDVESPDDMDRILMASPLSAHLEVEDFFPLRPYADFAEDVRRRWSIVPKGVHDPRQR